MSVKATIGKRCRAIGALRPDNGRVPGGAIVWTGPSAWDGEPIALVLNWSGCTETGDGANAKTGRMVQSYILRASGNPVEDLKTGADSSICGNCVHRPEVVRMAEEAGLEPEAKCYVNVGQGPRAVADGMARGIYPRVTVPEACELISGMPLRMGTYGDPGMVPASVWKKMAAVASYHTGYTHRTRDVGADLKGVCMASADSLEEAREFRADGWATFRVSTDPSEPRDRGEARCPASVEAGKRVTCETCPIALKCDGKSDKGGVWGRVILDHGPGGVGRAMARKAAKKKEAA